MVAQTKELNHRRARRQFRVRKSIHGTSTRPRMTIFRSHKHIYCQIIDDDRRTTLVSASTRDRGLRGDIKQTGNKDAASTVGKMIASRALSAGIERVCFDRGCYKYHGRVQALADAAREAGLQF